MALTLLAHKNRLVPSNKRQTDKWNEMIDRQIYKHTDEKIDRHTDGWMNRQTDRELDAMERQMDERIYG